MTLEEIKLQRLAAQHLLQKTDTRQVIKDLCGVQAQFLSHALHGLSIRCSSVDTSNLIKSWTNRGTMHLFSVEDLPLFLHQDRNHFLRPVDTLDSDSYISAARKAYFADVILSGIGEGSGDRETLKALCESKGMTESEAVSLFDSWGGIIRALCERGIICHKVQEKKAYQLCPAFEPMERTAAQRELLLRYFTHFGPATVKDAAYFFGWTQTRVKELLFHLPFESFCLDNRIFYYIAAPSSNPDIPHCVFLSGFDQLLLGYEKKESLFLPQSHLRNIFTCSGIVRPAVLIDGTVAGHWSLKGEKLHITLFEKADRSGICSAAQLFWPELKTITFE